MEARRRQKHSGFVLVAILVLIAAMLLLAVGVLSLSGIERRTARSHVDAKRAELMARAGMEHVRGILREETANDEYLIVTTQDQIPPNSNRAPLDYLYVARPSGGGTTVNFRSVPLFSTGANAADPDSVALTTTNLRSLPRPTQLSGGSTVQTEIFPWATDANLAWIPVTDTQGRVVGRYAYWVEDLQGRLDSRLAVVGNPGEAQTARFPYPHPAPGVNLMGLPSLEWSALEEEPGASGQDPEFVRNLRQNVPMLISPEASLAAAGFPPPLQRNTYGRLSPPIASILEQSAIVGLRSYGELALIPRTSGIAERMAGQPKVNLNRLLKDPRGAAIDKFAETIDRAMPKFVERKGGFPEDYLKTLAANALDYADRDSEPTIVEGEYRGLESFPLVSEHLVRFRWEKIETTEEGRQVIELSGTVYAELWNMSNHPASGEFQITYETNYTFDFMSLSDVNLGAEEVLDNPEIVKDPLPVEEEYHWLPPQEVTLQPNEYRVINCGTVTYRFDVGSEEEKVTTPLTLYGEDQGEVGYRMKWNGQIVDRSLGGTRHPDMDLNYRTNSKGEPTDTKEAPRQKVWATIPGHSYATARFDYVNNMGDPRMSWYIDIPQDPNAYPDNYSPNRRTIRWGNVYSGDGPNKPKVYGRVLPSEWPDGGHNSAFGQVPLAVKAGEGSSPTGDQRINPDDPQFMADIPAPEPLKAPMRLSNLGHFLSATELGNVYDPVMWLPTYESGGDTASIRNGYMPAGRSSWPLVADGATASSYYGGGNTLRIGRPEHPRFRRSGMSAAYLLDLFHAGNGSLPEGDDKLAENMSPASLRLNLNTATRDALRVFAAGTLGQDPGLSRRLSDKHNTSGLMAPPTGRLVLDAPRINQAADVIADAIIRSRPFTSAGELAAATDAKNRWVFGNPEVYSEGNKIEWTDSAAEEVFARVYNTTTVRSRNFRVWVIGQALVPQSGSPDQPLVLAESRKAFTLFANPGSRDSDGQIKPENYRPRVIYENDF